MNGIKIPNLPAEHYKRAYKIMNRYELSLSTVIRLGLECLERVRREEPRVYKLLLRKYQADPEHWTGGRVRSRPARQGKPPRDITRDELLLAQATCVGSHRAMARYLHVSRASIVMLLVKFGLADPKPEAPKATPRPVSVEQQASDERSCAVCGRVTDGEPPCQRARAGFLYGDTHCIRCGHGEACHPSPRAGDLPPMPEYELGPLS